MGYQKFDYNLIALDISSGAITLNRLFNSTHDKLKNTAADIACSELPRGTGRTWRCLVYKIGTDAHVREATDVPIDRFIVS